MAHMICTLFFVEAHFQFQLTATGSHNTLADFLSRNQVARFRTQHHEADIFSFLCTLIPLTVAAASSNGLDFRDLDPAVQHFCEQGIATTTRKIYQSALCIFADFCSRYNMLTPFPVSETLLCYYAAFLPTDRLSPQTIKVYLAAIRHMQITKVFLSLESFCLCPDFTWCNQAFNEPTVVRPQLRLGFQ